MPEPRAIPERQEPLEHLHARVFSKANKPKVVSPLDDAALLEQIRNSKQGAKFLALWSGETTGYESQSEADLALCSILHFWTQGDAPRVDRLFRQSGLMRPKWDERHYSDGRSYGEVTIATASEGATAKSSSSSTRQASSRALRTPNLIYMNTVEREEVAWLWKPYIPLSKATNLEGDPGLGKTFLALTIAASVTTGGRWPNVEGQRLEFSPSSLPPSCVIYLTAEDGLGDTLKPRLEAAGADCSKVAVIQSYREGEAERILTLTDLDVIDQALEQTQARLVVIDPIQGYLGAAVDMHRANEVRPILAGLGRLAEKHQCAVLAIRHLNKAQKGSALHRGLGSVDFTAFARSQLLIGKHNHQTVLAHVKSSLAPHGPSLAFEVRDGRLLWIGPSEATADEVAFSAPPQKEGDNGSSKLDEAVAFLNLLLDESPRRASDIKAEARQEGISSATLKRAKESLNLRSTRVNPTGEERGKGEWWWHYSSQIVSIGEDGELIVQDVERVLSSKG